MKIINFTFEDKSVSWKLEKVTFDNLTLLVGASGVGKTRILKSLMSLKSIIEGNTLNGVSWEIEFSTIDNAIYLWKGEFENKGWKNDLSLRIDDDDEIDVKNKPNLIFEELYLNGVELTKREKQKNYFKGNPIPNTAPTESNLKIFRVEEDIKPAYEALQKLIYSDYTTSQNSPLKGQLLFGVDKLLKKYKTLEKIKNSDEKVLTKLYMVYKNVPKTFTKIKDIYIDIFPYVENLKIEPLELGDDIPSILKEIPFIQIKEKGIEKWISQMELSAGMFRSLIHICELFLHSNGTVVLIDEFENSLGKNCIDEVTDIIVSLGKKQQFIITSHHPSIINKIDYKHWKLVTRKKGRVSIHHLKNLKLNKSQHQAYLHLINLDEFIEGVE